MRIISGKWRGTRLAALGKGDMGAHLRPTPDRVRESLFSILSARLDWDGLRVLDLFAGTGALGLEALSRGAETALFVENGRTGARLIRSNIDTLRAADQAQLMQADATRLPAAPETFDLIFLDPPYGKGLGDRALQSALAAGWIAPDALIVWEESSPQTAPDGFELSEHRRYGDTHLTFLHPVAEKR